MPNDLTPTPEWTANDLLIIDNAIKSGVTRVQFADRSVTYGSTKDLMQARTLIVNYLQGHTGQTPVRQSRVFTNKGWSD